MCLLWVRYGFGNVVPRKIVKMPYLGARGNNLIAECQCQDFEGSREKLMKDDAKWKKSFEI